MNSDLITVDNLCVSLITYTLHTEKLYFVRKESLSFK